MRNTSPRQGFTPLATVVPSLTGLNRQSPARGGTEVARGVSPWRGRIVLSILSLVLGAASWGQELPNSFVPSDNEAELTEESIPGSVSAEPQSGDSNVERQSWYPAQGVPSPGRSSSSPGADDGVFVNVEELKVEARRLEIPIPEDLMAMVGKLLEPNGSYEYEDELRLLVMRGTETKLAEAKSFIEALSASMQAAFEEELAKAAPQPVQIEAVVLIGRKPADRVVSATEMELPYAFPAELAHLGLSAEDLLPFAFGEVEVVGRAVLQSDIPNFRMRTVPVETTLAEHHLEFGLSQRAEPTDYVSLSVAATYIPKVEVVPTIGGVENLTAEQLLSLQVQAQQAKVGMKSEPKAVFERPILVGSYKPTPDETAIVAIRLTKTGD